MTRDICPMLSWYSVFPGACHWTADRQRVACDAPIGVELRVEPARKSDPILTADKPWEAGGLGWAQVLIDGGRYRLWYQTMGIPGNAMAGILCYAESDDGFHWRKPELGLVEFGGSRANNILMQHGREEESFIFPDPTAPPPERYRLMMHHVWHEGEPGEVLDEEDAPAIQTVGRGRRCG